MALKLAQLTDRAPVKLTIQLTPDQIATLIRAAFFANDEEGTGVMMWSRGSSAPGV